MTNAVQWRYRFLLGIVLLDLVLGSPVVKRQVVESLAQAEGAGAVEADNHQVQLSEDTFGPNLQERGEREKRLFDLKKLGVAGLGVKAVKAVGAKAVAAGAAAIKAKVVKAGAAAKAIAAGAVGLKAKAIGAKTITAIAVLGIKTFLFNLLFGKINKLIDFKERLLSALEEMNRIQNEAFNTNLFDIPKLVNPEPRLGKGKRSRKDSNNYGSGGGDSADTHRFDGDRNQYSNNEVAENEQNNGNNQNNVYFDEPDFLPPPKDLKDVSLTTESSIDYEDYSNSSTLSRSSEMYINNSALYELLWKKHGILRSPLHRHYLESQNLTASNETWSTESIFGDDDEDYESPEMPADAPKTPFNSPETPNNPRETFNNRPEILSNLIEALRNSSETSDYTSVTLNNSTEVSNYSSNVSNNSSEVSNKLSKITNNLPQNAMEMPNNSSGTVHNENVNNNKNIPDISSNKIPVRNYRLKRQKSFHNLKQFRKFYGRNPMKDKSIELSKAFYKVKNDPQKKHLDAYRLSKLFSNTAYKHPFDYPFPNRNIPTLPTPNSSEEKEINQNVFPYQLFPLRHFDPPMDPNVNKDPIVYIEWDPPTTQVMSRSQQRKAAVKLLDTFFSDVKLLGEKVLEYLKDSLYLFS